jgi:glycosyltransferase involved in cell wall biosynthesis
MTNKTPLVGYLGRLRKYKRVEHFLQAIPAILARFPVAQFVVVGEGNHRRNLERLAQSLGVDDRVHFTGAVSHREKVLLLNQMWVAVHPSPKEGWGLTVIEANACGTPVVAANSPGLRDAVVHNRTGLLYEYGHIQQLTEAVCRLLADDALRETMGGQARMWAERFDWDTSAEMTISLIKRTLRDRKRPTFNSCPSALDVP